MLNNKRVILRIILELWEILIDICDLPLYWEMWQWCTCVDRDRNPTVSGWFSKISLASSLLQSSSMHSLSRLPFLLSSNKELALLCLLRNWEAVLWLRTGTNIHDQTLNQIYYPAFLFFASVCIVTIEQMRISPYYTRERWYITSHIFVINILITHDWSQQESFCFVMTDGWWGWSLHGQGGQPNYFSVNWPWGKGNCETVISQKY